MRGFEANSRLERGMFLVATESTQGVSVSGGATMKPRILLPIRLSQSALLLRARTLPRAVFVFSILLAYFLLLFHSCKDIGIPPDRIIPDSTSHGPDTTSHNFIWTIDTLGDGGGSVLNDVAIINDTLIYAVGEIYLKDSTGQIDPLFYNLAVWDGASWSVQRVPYYYQGQPFFNPFQAVFALAADNVWFCGNGVMRWDGTQFIEMPVPGSVWGSNRMNKMWGTGNSMFVVGNGGSIAHFDGNGWTKIESGTTIDFQDIWGRSDPATFEEEILAVASHTIFVPQERTLIQIKGFTLTNVTDNSLPLALSSVWFVSSQKYFLGGDGLFSRSPMDSLWKQETNVPNYYVENIRGSGLNDIVWAGGLGLVAHYNGASWHYYAGAEIPSLQGNYYAVDVHSKLAVAVGGIIGGKAIALLGKR